MHVCECMCLHVSVCVSVCTCMHTDVRVCVSVREHLNFVIE